MSRTCPTCGKAWGTLWPADMRAIRKKAGLTLRQLSERLCIHFTYLSKVERGIYPPSPGIDRSYRELRASTQARP